MADVPHDFRLQSSLLLQDVGLLYMALKTLSGGPAFAQFVCQRVLPTIGLVASEIEGNLIFNCVCNLSSCTSTALAPVLHGDDAKIVGAALAAISRGRRAPP
jgi:hypothetical protein